MRCECCLSGLEGHKPLGSLSISVCNACLRANVVSNSVLLFRYGLHFCDFLERYHLKGGIILPLDVFHSRARALMQLSDDPLDTAYLHPQLHVESRWRSMQAGILFFMWKPHLEQILGLNLKQLQLEHNQRLQAAAVLCAFAKRRRLSPNFAGYTQTIEDLPSSLSQSNFAATTDPKYPINNCRFCINRVIIGPWIMPGGPAYHHHNCSGFLLLSPNPIALRGRKIKMRRGYEDKTRLQRLIHVFDSVFMGYKRHDHRHFLPPILPLP